MKKFNVAVVGATGMVGESMISILEERAFPIEQLTPIASKRSLGQKVNFRSEDLEIIDLDNFNFKGIDFAFFSAGALVSRDFAPLAAKAGALVIDNTSEFRYDDEIPLVVPEVNPSALSEYRAKNIVANPNCSTIQLMIALAPIHNHTPIKKINIATYQSISGAGRSAIELLEKQLTNNNNSTKESHQTFAHNVIPQIGEFQDNGYTLEEMKLVWETKKILGSKKIEVNATAVRVPVRVGHSEAVTIETETEVSVSLVNELLDASPHIEVMHGSEYPIPIVHGQGTNKVYVGRIRRDLSTQNSINLWVVADNIRKGAALNSIQIAETIIDSHL